MNKDIDAQFLCKDCSRYNLCEYYDRRKKDSYICKYFHLSEMVNGQQPRWIPVSERLPEEENKSYWICTDNGYQCECRWTNINHIWTNLTRDWHWHLMDISPYSKVVAWMPLLEPYLSENPTGSESEDI